MLKLYRRENGRVVAYHEAWIDSSRIIEHWGPLGERGETRVHRRRRWLSDEKNMLRVLRKSAEDGYRPIDLKNHAILLIEYTIDGFGMPADLDKRHALEDRVNELLGWTGLGMCDGGSIGSGSMECCCFVVTFDLAKRVIEEDLTGTEFADYTRIYEGADE